MYQTKRDALRGLIMVLEAFPEKERPAVLAQLERQVKDRGDLERLRAIRDYRALCAAADNAADEEALAASAPSASLLN